MKLIAIEYSDKRRYDAVYIDWTLGNFCNYKCSYCPDYLHDNSYPMSDVETVKDFTKRLFDHYTKELGKKYFIFNLMGGEPTVWKGIENFVVWLKEYSQQIGVTSYVEILTNGSRSLKWWANYAKFFDTVKITHHTEFADPSHTSQVADLVVDQGVYPSVQVTMIPNRWNECISHLNTIAQSKHQFRIDVKPLRVNFESTLYNYSEEQLKIFQQPYRTENGIYHTNTVGMIGRCIYDNKVEKTLRYQELITTAQNSWVGWDCWAGLDIINIKPDGTLRLGGACGMKDAGMVGKKITDSNINFRTKPIECKQQWCSCGPDMETRKQYVGR